MFLCTNFDTAFEIPAEPAGHTARPHGDVTQAQHCVDVESRQLLIAGPDRSAQEHHYQIYPPWPDKENEVQTQKENALSQQDSRLCPKSRGPPPKGAGGPADATAKLAGQFILGR